MKKLLALLISASLALSAGIAVSASDIGECKGDVPKIDTGIITIDGAKDSAYEQGLKVDINQFLSGTETGTYGIAYMLWADGSYYLLVEVHDADVQQPSADAQANNPWTTDSVEIFFDFGNEAVNLAEQFRIDCTGYPSYYIQGGAYYAYGPEDAAEYFDEYAASKTDDGYNIEMRINLKEAVEAYELAQGDSIGLQLQINDMTEANTSSTTAVYNMASSLLAGSWDVDRYDYITLGGPITVEADAPEAEADSAAPASEPEETAEPEADPAPTEPAPAEETVETPTTPAPVTETTAPQTFDMGVIAAACAVISAAGYAVSKKRR